ncbi:response regulator transcription factor [Cohnella herbarum]|uniref:Response regulator n=1 Tax=Cohnella herbarum TaxID=2728023 RepID=A0A7Z2ZP20_9BACL|nr:response regulator [Cohnella herbarum]QJD86873.1 response regulator [Cohnella herbarum]
MWKMMVVEDESIVRIGMRHMIDWESYGVKWELEASNGAEALSLLEDRTVDIVMTDIRMPVMDGIELIKKLKTLYPDIRIILVSSYNDFAYVQEALRLGVVDYLHKPTMTKQEIVSSMQRVIDKLEQTERGMENKQQDPKSNLQSLLTTITNDREIESEREDDEESILRASLFREGYWIAVIRLEPSDSSAELAGKVGKSLFPSVQSLIEGYAAKAEGSILIGREDSEIIWLLPSKAIEDSGKMEDMLSDIRRMVMNLLHVSIICGSSGIHQQHQRIRMAYNEAITKMSERSLGIHQTIRLAKEYVDLHFRQEISLSDCARHVHVSSGYLSRLFTKELGMNFSDYVTRKKLDQARYLLSHTAMRIQSISEEVGYSNAHYFSKQFKEYTGMTPSEFRRV